MSIRKHGNILAGLPTPNGDVANGDSRPVSGDAVHDAVQNYVPLSQKNAANGVAGLDENAVLPGNKIFNIGEEYPTTSTPGDYGSLYYRRYAKSSNAANRVPFVCVDKINDKTTWSRILTSSSLNQDRGLKKVSEYDQSPGVAKSDDSDIDARTQQYKPIVPNNLDYAVRSVLPNVTTIPAATTAYTLTDASATTNNHCHTYTHAPTADPTYTLPAVTDATIEHTIILTVDTTETVAIAFEDSQGSTIVPIRQPYLVAGDVVQYLCWWDPVQSKWIVIGDLVNSLEDPSNDDIYGG